MSSSCVTNECTFFTTSQLAHKPTAIADKLPPWLPLAIGGGVLGLGAILVLGAVILFFETPTGTLRVEINDPHIEVLVKGTDIVLTARSRGRAFQRLMQPIRREVDALLLRG